MYASYDTNNLVIQWVKKTGGDFVGSLLQLHGVQGASTSRLRQVVTGSALSNGVAEHVREVLLALQNLVNDAKPLPLKLDDAREIKGLMDAHRKGQLRLHIEYDKAPDNQGYLIHYNGGVITGFDSKNRPVVGPESAGLVFSATKLDQIQNFLLQSGYQATVRPTNRQVNTSDSSAVLF